MAFTDGEVEDGTGLLTALVYDEVAEAQAYLDARGLPAFGEADQDAQKAALIRATEAAEDEIRPQVRRLPATDGQGLIFPGFGAYDSAGRLMYEDERPQIYRHGIFLLADAVVRGKFMPLAATPSTIASESSARGSISYRPGANPASLAANHPDAWKKIRTAIPQV